LHNGVSKGEQRKAHPLVKSRTSRSGREVRLYFRLFISFFTLLILSACFFGKGIKNSGRVIDYKPGKVITQGGGYGVGVLPAGWRRVEIKPYRTISFRNDALESTITTDAFCDASFDDASLKTLTVHLHMGLDEQKQISQKELTLSGRAALRTVVQGKVDGVLMSLDTVVIKKDSCLFDFALVGDPTKYAQASSDFEKFYGAFTYNGQP